MVLHLQEGKKMAIKEKKKSAISGNIAKFLFWTSIIALCLVLIASVKHVQVTYLSIESVEVQNSSEISWPAWTMSLGLELTLVISAYILAIKRRRKEKPEKIYTVGIWGATILNFFGNIYFSLATKIGHMDLTMNDLNSVDNLVLLRMLLISGTVCLIALLLLEYISFFYVQIKSEEQADKVQLEKDRKKEESKALKEQRLAYRENSNVKAIQAELEAKKLEISKIKLDAKKPIQNRLDNVKVKPKIDTSEKFKVPIAKPEVNKQEEERATHFESQGEPLTEIPIENEKKKEN